MASLNELRLLAYGSVALATALVAVLLLAANPRRSWNQWLSFFLLLICGNYAAQALLAWNRITFDGGAIDAATFLATERLLFRLSWLFLLFDPAALAYFASIFPRRTGVLERRWGLPLLAGAVGGFVLFEVATSALSLPRDPFRPAGFVFFAYLALCYAYATHRLLGSWLFETSTVMARQLGIVAVAVVIVTVPRLALLYDDTIRYTGFDLGPVASSSIALAVRLGVLVAGFALIWRWVGRAPALPERRTEALRLLRLAGVAFVAFGALFALSRGGEIAVRLDPAVPMLVTDARDISEMLVFAVRWLVFSAAMVVGIVRYQVLTVQPKPILAAGAVGAALGGGLVVAEAAAAFGPWAAASAAAALFSLGLGAALYLHRREGAGRDYLHERALDVYRAQLAANIAAGPLDDAASELLRARARLGVSGREHETLLAIAQAEEARAPARGELLGRYQVLRRLGAGGYATVYLARDRPSGDLVVLKHIREDAAGSRAALESALRELEVARRVSHPNLVAVHDMVRIDDGAVVVMAYAEGGSLRELLDREHRLPPARAVALLREALAGLAALHEAGIVHGDLKPENLLLQADGTLQLADFGTARGCAPGRTLVGARGEASPAGTLLYMAPEQVRGERPMAASDLYAMAAVFHEALTGKPYVDARGLGPWEAMSRILRGPTASAAGLEPHWRAFLAKALAIEPRARYRSAAAMLGALEGLEVPGAGARATRGLPTLRKRWEGV